MGLKAVKRSGTLLLSIMYLINQNNDNRTTPEIVVSDRIRQLLLPEPYPSLSS